MATIIHDTKTAPAKIAAKIHADQSNAKSIADAKRKLRIHITCIIIAGIVSTALFQLHISNSTVLGFGPFTPSIAQEIFDRLFRL